MKRIFLSFALFAASFSNAQDYYHGLGVQGLMGLYKQETQFSSSSVATFVPGVVYKASLGFEINRNSNFAVSAYPFAGFYFNSQIGGYLGVQLPVLAEIYFADMDDQNFYIGAGGAWGFIAQDGEGGSIVGPQLGMGGQFEFRDQLVGLRASYTYGLNKTKTEGITYTRDSKSMISVGLYYLLGQ